MQKLNKIFLIIFSVIIILFLGYILYTKKQNLNPKNFMQITSPAFVDGGMIPKKYTCDGENISPPLQFSEVPQNTVSLVLIVDDPDAPGGIWDHFVQFNIPANVREIPEGAKLEGVKGKNSFANLDYGGPCPPNGAHNYRFFLYALDQVLDLKEGATKSQVLYAMQNHILDQAILDGKYSR